MNQLVAPRLRTHGSMCAQADYCLANVDVDDEGAVMISGNDPEQMEACAAKIVELTAEDAKGGGRKQRAAYDGPMPEVGSVYASEVVSIKTFGAFVSFGRPFRAWKGSATFPSWRRTACGTSRSSSVSATPSTSKY